MKKWIYSSIILCLISPMVYCMSTPPADEIVFKGSDETIKPSATISKLTKVTKSNRNIYPSSSQDGKIVFSSYTTDKSKENDSFSSNADILISSGNVYRSVTNDSNDNQYPCFVGATNKIIYSSNRLGTEKIWIVDASGKGGTVQLTMGNSNDQMPNVSPDGKKVAYCAFSRYYKETLGITEYGARWKVWNLVNEMPTIWTVDIDGRNVTQYSEGIKPVWSPDGKKIAYYKLSGTYYQVWIMDSDGSNQTQISNGDFHSIEPSWAPDGKTLVFASNAAGNYDIWSQKIDGTELTQLTIQDSYEGAPVCSPDGKSIYFHSFAGGEWNIWKMDLSKQLI